MRSTLIAPEFETFPDRYRWSVEACYRLMEIGVLEGRFEVLDGEVVSKMGQNPPHYFAISRLTLWANAVFGDEFVRIQGPITLPAPDGVYSEPEPDVALLSKPSTDYANRHPGPADLRLVIEVSDTTLRTDLVLKARLYARAEIAEYWVVDLTARQLHIHLKPTNGEYAVVTAHAETETVAPASCPESTIDVSSLLPPATI